MTEPRFTVSGSTIPGGPPIVTATGDLDLSTAKDFVDLLVHAAAETSAITVDMQGVTFCDSSAVRALFAVAATTRLTLLIRAAGPMTKLLSISGLDRIATVTTT